MANVQTYNSRNRHRRQNKRKTLYENRKKDGTPNFQQLLKQHKNLIDSARKFWKVEQGRPAMENNDEAIAQIYLPKD